MKITEYKNGLLTCRKMDSDEIADMERMAAEMPTPEPTIEEQLADLIDLVGVLTEVICSD